MIDYFKKFRLDGKTSYVVGGLGLIGKEVSSAFASAGAKTIILDLESEQGVLFEEEMREASYDLNFKPFDCSDIDIIEENFSAVLDEFGAPDLFINCSYPRTEDWGQSSFQDVSLVSYRENVDRHMNSYSWLARLAAESMVRNGKGGSIVQLGSTYGIVGQDLTIYKGTAMHENMTYSVIKGGIISLTRQMASYYGQFNIRVNTLCPGGLKGHVAGKSIEQDQTFVKQYKDRVPIRRLGRPDEIASTALFMSSEAASYMTGATIIIDGGWTAI